MLYLTRQLLNEKKYNFLYYAFFVNFYRFSNWFVQLLVNHRRSKKIIIFVLIRFWRGRAFRGRVIFNVVSRNSETLIIHKTRVCNKHFVIYGLNKRFYSNEGYDQTQDDRQSKKESSYYKAVLVKLWRMKCSSVIPSVSLFYSHTWYEIIYIRHFDNKLMELKNMALLGNNITFYFSTWDKRNNLITLMNPWNK